MKRLLQTLLGALLCLSLTACDFSTTNTPMEPDDGPGPVAQFDFQLKAERVVSFNSTSMGATRHAWLFGDGERGTTRSPEHRYAEDGTYRVVLTVFDDLGRQDTTDQTITVVCVIRLTSVASRLTISVDILCRQAKMATDQTITVGAL